MFNKLFKKDKIYNIWEDIENYEEINHVKIKLPLYYESKYEGLCFYNYILGLKHFRKDLDYIFKTR